MCGMSGTGGRTRRRRRTVARGRRGEQTTWDPGTTWGTSHQSQTKDGSRETSEVRVLRGEIRNYSGQEIPLLTPLVFSVPARAGPRPCSLNCRSIFWADRRGTGSGESCLSGISPWGQRTPCRCTRGRGEWTAWRNQNILWWGNITIRKKFPVWKTCQLRFVKSSERRLWSIIETSKTSKERNLMESLRPFINALCVEVKEI